MVSRSDAVEAYSWAAGSAVDLLTRPETRRALFAALDTLPNDHTSTRQLTELTRAAVMLRSLRVQLDNTTRQEPTP